MKEKMISEKTLLRKSIIAFAVFIVAGAAVYYGWKQLRTEADDEGVQKKSDIFKRPVFWAPLAAGILFDPDGLCNPGKAVPAARMCREHKKGFNFLLE